MTIQHLRDLHTETTADAYSVACSEGDCSGHDGEGDCPVTEVGICDYCYDRSGGVEYIPDWMLWPCETIRALDAPADVEVPATNHESEG